MYYEQDEIIKLNPKISSGIVAKPDWDKILKDVHNYARALAAVRAKLETGDYYDVETVFSFLDILRNTGLVARQSFYRCRLSKLLPVVLVPVLNHLVP